MKETYKDFIGIYENVLSDEYTNEIINIFDQNKYKFQPRVRLDRNNNLIASDRAISSDQINIASHIDFFNNILDKKILPRYFSKYPSFLQTISESSEGITIIPFQIQETSPGEGYHKFHSEWGGVNDIAYRILTYTAYLNDINEGGETEFLYQHSRLKPKKGTIVIFPSFCTHFHRGNPPLKNNKYIVTGWITLKPLKIK